MGRGATPALVATHLVGAGYDVSRAVLCSDDALDTHDGDARVLWTAIGRTVWPSAPTARRAILAATDVVVQNAGSDALGARGLSRDDCRRANRELIYVSLPAFASDDDAFEHARGVAHDAPPHVAESLACAAAGAYTDMGLNRTLLGIRASYSPLHLAAGYASLFAAYGIQCAMLARARRRADDGAAPTDLEVAMASAVSEALVHNSLEFERDDRYLNPRQRRLRNGRLPVDEDELDRLFDPFFRLYDAADARPVYLVCPSHARHQRRALRVLGVEDEVLRIVAEVDTYRDDDDDDGRHAPTPPPHQGIGCGSLDESDAAAVYPILARAFLTRPAAEWERAFGRAGVPAVAVRTSHEWARDRHAVEAGLVADDGVGGRTLAPVAWYADPRPAPDEETTEEEDGDDGGERAAEEEEAAAPTTPDKPKWCAQGLRVVDCSNVIAGPTIGYYLARAGADVIKVDPPTPTYSPEIAVFYGLATNRHKRSVLLDIQHPKGRLVLERLLRDADVLIVNCTPECLRRMRLTRDDLEKINPRLVLAHFDCFGGPREAGALRNHVGYDDTVQAVTGMMHLAGGGRDMAACEEVAHVGTVDVISGVAGAFATLVALTRRATHGTVVTARSSLAAAAQYLQFPVLLLSPNYDPPVLGRGRACIGRSAAHRCVRDADDGWVFVADDAYEHRVDGGKHAAAGISVRMTSMATLRRRCATDAADAARRDALVDGRTFAFFRDADHPVGPFTCVAPVAVRMRGMRHDPLARAPKYGEHTKEVLDEIGETLADLVRAGAAATRWSRDYVPFSTKCDACGQRGSCGGAAPRALVVLRCGHRTCRACRTKALATNGCCPACGEAQELDADALRRERRGFASGYASWRRGGAKGSVDRKTTRRPSSPRRRGGRARSV